MTLQESIDFLPRGIRSVVKADPAATTANTIAFTGFAAIALVIAWLAYRPLFGLPVPGRKEGGSE